MLKCATYVGLIKTIANHFIIIISAGKPLHASMAPPTTNLRGKPTFSGGHHLLPALARSRPSSIRHPTQRHQVHDLI